MPFVHFVLKVLNNHSQAEEENIPSLLLNNMNILNSVNSAKSRSPAELEALVFSPQLCTVQEIYNE